MNLNDDILKAFKGGIANPSKFVDLLVLLYELFMFGRRKGHLLPASMCMIRNITIFNGVSVLFKG